MSNADGVSGLVLFGLGSFIAVEAWRLDVGTLAEPGPGFFPFWAGVLLALFAAAVVAAAWTRPPGAVLRVGLGDLWHHRIAVCIVALVAYGALLRWVGFGLCTFGLLLGLSRLDARTSWRASVLIAGLGAAGFYLVFVRFLGVSFPRGAVGF